MLIIKTVGLFVFKGNLENTEKLKKKKNLLFPRNIDNGILRNSLAIFVVHRHTWMDFLKVDILFLMLFLLPSFLFVCMLPMSLETLLAAGYFCLVASTIIYLPLPSC